jgi:hypothetical protein
MILFQTQVLHSQNEAYDLCINLIIGMFLIHCNIYFIAMYSIIRINIGPILAFGTGPQILQVGASVKRSRSMARSGTGGGGVLRAKRSRSTACSRDGGDDVLPVKRLMSRAKRSSGVEGVLRRRRRAPGIGGVEDLKRVSGKNLLSVERAARTPDIYIGARCTMCIH